MDRIDPKSAALVIQDLQNDVIIEGGAFADSGAPAHATAQNVVENVKSLAAACRSAGVPVIHVWYIVEPGAPGLKQNAPLFQGVKEANALVRGTWGAAPAEGLEPQDGDHVVEKMRMNGFYETRLDILLRGPRRRDADHHRRVDEHVDRAHRAPRRRRRLPRRRRLRRHVDDRRRVAERRAELRDAERRDGRDLQRDRRGARRHGQRLTARCEGRPVVCGRPSRKSLRCGRCPRPSTCRSSSSQSDSGETFPVENPATGETIAQVPRMGAAETRRALARAEEALPAWRSMLAKDRARILRRWADLMLENEDGLARLLTTEQGKPLAESRIEIAYAASFYEWFGEEGKRVYGDTIPTYAADRRIVVTKEPDRRHRRHHAVELPGGDADAQVGARARRGLHDGAEAGRADAALRARDRAARARGRPARTACSRSSRAPRRTHR